MSDYKFIRLDGSTETMSVLDFSSDKALIFEGLNTLPPYKPRVRDVIETSRGPMHLTGIKAEGHSIKVSYSSKP